MNIFLSVVNASQSRVSGVSPPHKSGEYDWGTSVIVNMLIFGMPMWAISSSNRSPTCATLPSMDATSRSISLWNARNASLAAPGRALETLSGACGSASTSAATGWLSKLANAPQLISTPSITLRRSPISSSCVRGAAGRSGDAFGDSDSDTPALSTFACKAFSPRFASPAGTCKVSLRPTAFFASAAFFASTASFASAVAL
mmetsp:Transcript_24362/g.76396  ORF Transcript_24362/g.76396 Transcript_24362/m.76396 type:complete len:201 (-) Transcript_24362:2147-2749(-)